MLFSILVIASMTVPVPNQPLTAPIREMTIRMLLSGTDSEGAAIDKDIQDIYAKHGLLAKSEVGDEAAYDFIFLRMDQPRAFQTAVLRTLKQPGVDCNLPPDAVTFFRTRFRLDGIKVGSQDKPPSDPAPRDTINKLYESDQAAAKGGIRS
jgi:hypothetical protein